MRFVWVSMLIFCATSASADPVTPIVSPVKSPLPLIEYGLGLGAAQLPHYPGSDQSRLFVLPVPYFVYRGSVLRSDREEGTRARFWRAENFEVSLSGGGAIPVSSDGNSTRDGMGDLGWVGEVGPKVSYRFDVKASAIVASLAVRSVLSANEIEWPRHLGTTGEFALDCRLRRWAHPNMDFIFGLSTTFVSEGVASYFYQVEQKHVRDGRPEYNASAGNLYSTFNAGLQFIRDEGRERMYIGTSFDTLDGSSNKNSPLMKTYFNSTLVFSYIFVLGRSEIQGDQSLISTD